MSSSENENYEGKDPMSPEKITSHEPTAVKREHWKILKKVINYIQEKTIILNK